VPDKGLVRERESLADRTGPSVSAELAIRRVTDSIPAKPPEGADCNGCGLCCVLQLCDLAVEFLKADAAPCPVLEFAAGRFWCGLARNPSRYLDIPCFADKFIRPMVHQALSIGEGCDCGD
jgi:hypothetical protein